MPQRPSPAPLFPSVRAVVALAALAVGLASGCMPAAGAAVAGGNASASTLTLVAYSTPREVYEALIPMFAATDAGKGIRFEQSYGSSGEQSRAVHAGLPADIIALSLAPDVDRLVKPGIIAADWAGDAHRGMVSDSVVVIAVRKGNPKGISGWEDLVKPGIEVITPNPFTSGGAKWNVMAAYGAAIERGGTEVDGVAFLRALFRNVPVQDKSAREALQTFVGGKGDAMIAYENEAITAQQKGEQLDYVVPDQTILIENPIAVTTSSRNAAAARAFLDFARTEPAQKVFGEKGYRPVVKSVLDAFPYPAPPGLFTIADLGGWSEVNERFFDKDLGLMAGIEREIGVEP